MFVTKFNSKCRTCWCMLTLIRMKHGAWHAMLSSKTKFCTIQFFLDIGSIEYNEVAFCLKPSSKSGLVKRSFIHSFVHKLCFFKPSLFPPFCRGQAFSRFEPGVPRPSRSVCPTFPPADRGGVWRLPFWICLTLRILGPSKLASFWDPRPLLLYRLKKPFQDP